MTSLMMLNQKYNAIKTLRVFAISKWFSLSWCWWSNM